MRLLSGLGILLICLTANSAFAVEPIPSNSAEAFKPLGKIVFEEKSHDFGSVKRGAKLTHQFKFSNQGKGVLVIQGVHAACGCTVVSTDKGKVNAYQPGEAGFVEVVFDTTNFSGRIDKDVTVITNETTRAATKLTLNASISSEIAAKPPLLDFGDVNASTGESQSFVVEAEPGVTVAADQIRYTKETLEVAVEALANNKWKFTVKLKPNVGTGFLKDMIYIPNSSVSLKELPVPIRANVQGNIRVSHNYIEFGAVAPKDAAMRTVDLVVDGGYEIVGSKAEININGSRVSDVNPFVDIKIDPKGTAGRKIAVKLKNATENSGSVHGKLLLQTTDPRQKELVVDFYAFFR